MRKMSFLITAVILFLAAFALRLYHLDTVSLRGDEAYSVLNWTNQPFSDHWWTILTHEPHPIGAFLVYIIWTKAVGITEFAVRMLPVLSSLLALAVVFRFARKILINNLLALVIGLLFAVNPLIVWHAQDARTLSVLTFLSALNLYLFLRWLDNPTKPHWPFILTQTLTLYISYVEAFNIATQLVVFLLLYRPHWRKVLQTYAIIGILVLPVVLQLFNFVLFSRFETHSTNPDFSNILTWFAPTLLFGDTRIPLWLGVLGVGVFILALMIILRRDRKTGLILSVSSLVPVLVFIVASAASAGFFLPGYLIIVVMPVLVTIVHAVRNKPAFLTVAMVFFVGLSAIELYNYFYVDTPKAPDWRALSGYLAERMQPNDVLLMGIPDTAAEYYVDRHIYFVPPGNENPTADFETLLTTYDTVYVSGDSRAEAARQFFTEKTQTIRENAPFGVIQFRPWPVKNQEIQYQAEVQFGEVAELNGYSFYQGDDFGSLLFLYWETLGQTEEDYSVLVHVSPGTVSEAVAVPPAVVLDHGIADAIISTRTWSTGAVYRDYVIIPSILDPGSYTVWIGFYSTGTNKALSVYSDKASENRYPLFTFNVDS